MNYVREVVIKTVLVTIVCMFVLFFVIKAIGHNNIQCIIVSLVICTCLSYLLGFNRDDKRVLNNFIKEKLHI